MLTVCWSRVGSRVRDQLNKTRAWINDAKKRKWGNRGSVLSVKADVESVSEVGSRAEGVGYDVDSSVSGESDQDVSDNNSKQGRDVITSFIGALNNQGVLNDEQVTKAKEYYRNIQQVAGASKSTVSAQIHRSAVGVDDADDDDARKDGGNGYASSKMYKHGRGRRDAGRGVKVTPDDQRHTTQQPPQTSAPQPHKEHQNNGGGCIHMDPIRQHRDQHENQSTDRGMYAEIANPTRVEKNSQKSNVTHQDTHLADNGRPITPVGDGVKNDMAMGGGFGIGDYDIPSHQDKVTSPVVPPRANPPPYTKPNPEDAAQQNVQNQQEKNDPLTSVASHTRSHTDDSDVHT